MPSAAMIGRAAVQKMKGQGAVIARIEPGDYRSCSLPGLNFPETVLSSEIYWTITGPLTYSAPRKTAENNAKEGKEEDRPKNT